MATGRTPASVGRRGRIRAAVLKAAPDRCLGHRLAARPSLHAARQGRTLGLRSRPRDGAVALLQRYLPDRTAHDRVLVDNPARSSGLLGPRLSARSLTLTTSSPPPPVPLQFGSLRRRARLLGRPPRVRSRWRTGIAHLLLLGRMTADHHGDDRLGKPRAASAKAYSLSPPISPQNSTAAVASSPASASEYSCGLRPITVSPPTWATMRWPMPARVRCRAIAGAAVPLRIIPRPAPACRDSVDRAEQSRRGT